RTYLEMIQGIARTGVPRVENGPVQQFPELRAAWNVYHAGQLWGSLPPVYTYVAAPVFRLGGVRALVKMNVLLVGVLALGTFAVGRRLTGQARSGVIAAFALLISAPGWTHAWTTSPYPLACALLAWCSYCVICAHTTAAPASRLWAALAGL